MLRCMSFRLVSRRLYIADLARRQQELEQGRVAMQPLAYRVLSRRLCAALADLPEPMVAAGFAELPPHLSRQVSETLSMCHFEHHGRLPGKQGAAAAAEAAELFRRLRK